MSGSASDSVLAEALKLSSEERELLAFRLMESVGAGWPVGADVPAGDPARAPVRRFRLRAPDGSLAYAYLPSRDHALHRLRETKPLRETSPLPSLMRIESLSCGAVFGALWSCFGPPHDIHDDWKQSISYYFDVAVEPRARGLDGRPVRLLLEVSDWKGGLRVELRMPRRDSEDHVLEHGEDVLPAQVRPLPGEYLVGFARGYAETGSLLDFERTHPGGKGRFGVRRGVPFDEAAP